MSKTAKATTKKPARPKPVREFEVARPAVGPKRFTRKQIRDAVRSVNKSLADEAK